MIDDGSRLAALHEGTLVHTARGLIPVRDLEPGDTTFFLDEATKEIRPGRIIQLARSGQTGVGLRGKALEKRIPSWVFASPEEHRLAFLGGYVDADGSIRTPGPRGRNKDMGLTSANPDLLEDARRLAITCGVRTSSIWDFQSRHVFDRERWMTGYRMNFSGDFDRISCRAAHRISRMRQRKWFHNDTSIGGTTVKAHTSPWLGFARVERVTRVERADAYVLRVEGGNVLAESLVVRA